MKLNEFYQKITLIANCYKRAVSYMSVANPDPEVRSSGMVYTATLYRSAVPDLWIRIRQI